jgi:uncharacterized protein
VSETWKEVLLRDHEVTERLIAAVEKAFDAPDGPPASLIAGLRRYAGEYVDACHNQKEEQHLFPALARRGLSPETGPVSVMLAEHEHGRTLLARMLPLCDAYASGERERLGALRAVFGEWAALVKDHFWKENDVLFTMAASALTDEDGAAVLRGIEQIEDSIGPGTRARYHALAEELVRSQQLEDLSFGLEREVLAAILNTLPVELSFVDADDTVRYFSHEHGEKIFGRTRGVIGMQVHNCHPQKSVHVVKQILADFKAGKRDVAEFWIDLGPKRVHIRYWPVRDAAGQYLGCLETVQDITAIQKLTGQKRLLDGE